jgi:glycosyltransferase involved in cell wall biosynthesis
VAKRVLFIDGQVFQSAAWDRGMGKYSIALLKHLVANPHNEYDETIILFTDQMQIPSNVKDEIKKAAPSVTHVIANLSVPEDPCTADIISLQAVNENVLDETIHEHAPGAQSDYLIMSLFIDQVCSVFPSSAQKKILLFYDLIPLQYVERYSQLCSFPNYLKRFKTLFEADLIWTISQTVADDVVINLGINPAKIFNIDGAPIERQSTKAQKPSFKIPERYALMPSGNDLRKNNLRAVQGFEDYLRKSGDDAKLIITSHFDDNTRKQLKAYSSNIIFTGNVEEAELQWLYQHALTLLFVPEYEGLGLPILEAVEAKKPIVCSNIGVFNEISTSAFYYCNQFDSDSIGSVLADAIANTGLCSKLEEYPSILKRYSWHNTAGKALACTTQELKPKLENKPKLAIFAPSPAGYSDIGKRVLQSHSAMAEFFIIDYYLEDGKTGRRLNRPNYLPAIANVFTAETFTKDTYRDYDAVLYHLGNSEYHVETIKNALYLPGYAVFHDTHLTNIFEAELSEYGYVSRDRFDQEALLDQQLKNKTASFLTSLANSQKGMIVHSKYAEKAIAHTLQRDSPILRVNLPVPTPQQVNKKLPGDQVVIGFAGIIHPAKGLDIIEAVAQNASYFDCKIHIFGLSLVADEVIRRLESYPNVTVDINVTDFEFQQMLRDVDVLVNFRKDYRGETSAATLEAMRFGAIPIIRKVGWYDELPDEIVLRAGSSDEVMEQLKSFINMPLADRRDLSVALRKYIEQNFNYQNYAQKIYDFFVANQNSNTANSNIARELRNGSNLKKIAQIIDGSKS